MTVMDDTTTTGDSFDTLVDYFLNIIASSSLLTDTENLVLLQKR